MSLSEALARRASAAGLAGHVAAAKQRRVAACSGALLLLAGLLPGSVQGQEADLSQYRDVCDDGDLAACNTLGLIHESARGDGRALEQAADLYRRACAGGYLPACTNLGIMLEAGSGVPRKAARAAEVFGQACEGGEALACDRLRGMELAGLVPARGPSRTTGRVADADSRAVLADAIVAIPGLGIQSVTDAAGRFELVELPPGQHMLRAERLGYQVVERDLTVPGTPELLVLMPEADIAEASEPGRVVGRVTDAAGRDVPLVDVDVAVAGQERARTLSNQQGRFTLRDVEPGLLQVRFGRLGYADRTATLLLQPGRTVEVAAALTTEPIELDPIQVTVRSSFLEQSGFYDRAGGGWGTYFTADQIGVSAPSLPSDFLRGRVPGVRFVIDPLVNESRAITRRSRSLSGDACTLPVYVDGVELLDANLDRIGPEEIDAVEVYNGVAGAPVQYVSARNNCGVVLIWTRR